MNENNVRTYDINGAKVTVTTTGKPDPVRVKSAFKRFASRLLKDGYFDKDDKNERVHTESA